MAASFRIRLVTLSGVVALALFGDNHLLSATERHERPRIGQKVTSLPFKDIRFLRREIQDFGDRQAYVFVATNTTCPLVQRYIPKLNRLNQEFLKRNVQFISLNVASKESIPEMAAHAIEMEINFPIVKDVDGQCVKQLGLQRTPEVVVLDKDLRIRYRGRIDDQYRLGGARPAATSESLHDALIAILDGNEPVTRETTVDGCLITAASDPNVADVTYSDHIRPIIQANCVDCHRPGTETPFSLGTYDDVTRQGEMIVEVTNDRRMPPWYGSPQESDFANHRKLSRKHLDQITTWVAAGMPRGEELTESPLAPPATGKWRIGEPSLVVPGVKTHELPADGYVPYQYDVLPFRFEHDTWVQAIQIMPDNPRAVHHCNLLAIPAGKLTNQAEFITGKVPGSEPLELGNGVAVLIPAGTSLMLQIHFTTTGKPERCRLDVGFRYAAGRIDKQFRHLLLKNTTFEIPPETSHYAVTESAKIDRPTQGMGLFTHMHLRGKDMTFWAHHVDGTSEKLLTVPNYNFDWQMAYRWSPGQREFPAGTRFEVVAHFDNSRFNPFNPDPTATVREGPQTFHEMMYGFYFYTFADEKLKLEIDPTTGRVTTTNAKKDAAS